MTCNVTRKHFGRTTFQKKVELWDANDTYHTQRYLSYSASKALETMDDHLSKYGVNISKQVFAITADGVDVMKKCGNLSDADYQGFYLHALHLAVCDVLYSQPKDNDEDEPNEEDWGDVDGNDGEIDEGVLILEESDGERTIGHRR